MTTTTHFRLPAVFFALAAIVSSLFIAGQPAEASHTIRIELDQGEGFECTSTGGHGTATFDVFLRDQFGNPTLTDRDITVSFETVATGSATPGTSPSAGVDYIVTSTRETIPAGTFGEAQDVFEVPLVCDGDNTTQEQNGETFGAYMFNADGATFASESHQQNEGIIKNGGPDPGPQFAIFGPDDAVTEADSGSPASEKKAAVFTVRLDDTSSGGSVEVGTEDGSATAANDYNSDSKTLVWLPGEDNEKTFPVSLKHDDTAEPEENFFARLSNPSPGTSISRPLASATIKDDDASRVSVMDAISSEGASPFKVPFTIDQPISDDVIIEWHTVGSSASAGQDYAETDTTTTIPASQSRAHGSVAVTDDGDLETWHENFYVVVDCVRVGAAACGDEGQAAVARDTFGQESIQDNEPKISVADATSDEGESMTFTVTLSEFRQDSQFPNGADDEISVDFETVGVSATQGDDYTGKSGTLTWTDEDREAGNRTKQVTIDTKQDGDAEGNETFNLVLSNAQFAGIKQDEPNSNPGQGLITDDDAFNVDAGAAKSGESAAEVTFTGSASCPPDESCTYTWNFGDGSDEQTGKEVQHRYDDTGTYTVTLTVESSSGASASDTTPATITDSGKVDRDSGTDREKTAVAVSSKNWTQADTVLLATGYKFPDALAAGPLAQKLDAPLLLTNPNGLPDEVKNELDRLNAEKVIILGGPQVVPQSQANELAADGYTVERIAGINRFGTSADIATRVGATPTNEVTVALGEHSDPNRDAWPDALSAGSFASLPHPLPALLTHNQFVPQETLDALEDLGTERIFLLGGPVAISDAVESQLESEGYEVQRVFGNNRYDTSVEAAEIAMSRYPAGQVHPVFATGLKFPDGLSGGALAGKVGGPVVLVPNDDLSTTPSVRTFLRDHANRFDVGTVVGGPTVISDNVKNQARSDIDAT